MKRQTSSLREAGNPVNATSVMDRVNHRRPLPVFSKAYDSKGLQVLCFVGLFDVYHFKGFTDVHGDRLWGRTLAGFLLEFPHAAGRA